MKITIDITPEQEAGLAIIVAAFNARQGDTDNLTAEEYASNEFAHVARQWEGAGDRELVAKLQALPPDKLAEVAVDIAPAIEAKAAEVLAAKEQEAAAAIEVKPKE